MELYRHSGRIPLLGIPLTVVLGAAAAIVLGIGYGFITVYDPIIYINALLTVGFGYAVGRVVSYGVRVGKIRSTWLATAYGFIFGMMGLYAAWVADFWARIGTKVGLRAADPTLLWMYLQIFYAKGFWTFSGHGGQANAVTVSGIPLAIIWLIEAGAIVGFATHSAYKTVAWTPFCEPCDRWTQVESKVQWLQAEADLEMRLAAGDLSALASASLATGCEPCFLQLQLAQCPNCGTSNFLTVSKVTNQVDRQGKPKQVTRMLVKHLILSDDETTLVRAVHNVDEPPPALEQNDGQSPA